MAQEEQETSPGTMDNPVYINSTPDAYAGMLELPFDEPFHMLNLIRYKDKATYEEGSEFASKNWSGEEAYTEYTSHSSPIVASYGAKPIYLGQPQITVIGPEYEKWDVMFVVSYPSYEAFTKFVSDPEYKKHAFHRSAAVADSRLVRISPAALPK